MNSLHIITPVKDSIDFTLETAKAILASDLKVPFTYTIYNDFSTPENTRRLEQAAREMNFRLVNLADLTDHLNTIEKDINNLKSAMSSWVPGSQDGGAALKSAVTSWAGKQLTLSQRGDYEDEAVKH